MYILLPALYSSSSWPDVLGSQFKPCRLLVLQAVSHTLPHALFELGCILAPQCCGFDVRGRLIVWTRQHRDNGEEDRLRGLDG